MEDWVGCSYMVPSLLNADLTEYPAILSMSNASGAYRKPPIADKSEANDVWQDAREERTGRVVEAFLSKPLVSVCSAIGRISPKTHS